MAVPSRQQVPTFGQRACSHTVFRSSSARVRRIRWYASPPGARTRNQGGLGWVLGIGPVTTLRLADRSRQLVALPGRCRATSSGWKSPPSVKIAVTNRAGVTSKAGW